MLQEREEELSQDTGWRMKIVEASGFPLVQLLKSSFVMEKGCALGLDCHLCDNTGIGCATKNVVYSAECVLCSSEHTEDQYEDTISSTRALFHEATENTEEQYQEVISIPSPQPCEGTLETEEQYQDVISSLSPQHMEANQQIYIGETSRPIRNRVLEHLKKAEKFSPDSFIMQHWCKVHGTDTKRPGFKFKVVSSHREALSRQICEAILIEETGTLNSKSEFGMNHLCRMVTAHSPWKTEKIMESEAVERNIGVSA